MKKKKEVSNWTIIIPSLFFILAVVFIVWGIFDVQNKIDSEAQDFCENKLNGTIKSYDSRICLFEREGIVYGLKIMKYKDEWRVYVE
jgi:hypothetical protein